MPQPEPTTGHHDPAGVSPISGWEANVRDLAPGLEDPGASSNGSISGRFPRILLALAVRLARTGIDRALIIKAYGVSVANGTSFTQELVAGSVASEIQLAKAVADELGLKFEQIEQPDTIALSYLDTPESIQSVSRVSVDTVDGLHLVYLAPVVDELESLRMTIAQSDDMRQRCRITTRSNLISAMRERQSNALAKQAIDTVENVDTRLSARIVASTWQAATVGMLCVLLPLVLWIDWIGTLWVVHVVLTFFFLGCVCIRLACVRAAQRFRERPAIKPYDPRDLPDYTVLVALHHEAALIPQLTEALSKLRWPRSKLAIRLVCEADDDATLNAIRAHPMPTNFDVILVPVLGPRTKPKALNYGLLMVRSEFVAIYDAEDRPHPEQLLEAWQKFSESDDGLACVQAPLVISNMRENWLSRMFAFEYAALFRGLLPWLSERKMVLPLGGTSNHFRRSCLTQVGCWDPFNMTEDADLGTRLARFGYHAAMITRETLEEAPTLPEVWFRQRTRWLKGWMQTWLVHMRSPARFCHDLGPARFIVNQLLMTGVILSALFHPLMIFTLITMVIMISSGGNEGVEEVGLFTLDSFNILTSYLAFHALGKTALSGGERKAGPFFIWIPVYWVMMSFAAWRAVWQLFRAPFLWEKTPHRPVATGKRADTSSKEMSARTAA